jgi:hypothetical protein
VLDPSAFEFAESTVKLRRHKSAGNDQIPAKLIYAVGRTIRSEIHKLINFVWNTEELPEQWKESIPVPVYKKGDKTDCSNFRGISLFPTTYKILTNILLFRLTSYVQKIIGYHQCGIRRNWSTTVDILHLSNTLEKKGNTMKQSINCL